MSNEQLARLICYVAGMLLAMVYAGMLARVRHSLARGQVVAMMGWAFNAGMLLWFLAARISTGDLPPAAEHIKTVNAILIPVIPGILIAFWLRLNGSRSQQ